MKTIDIIVRDKVAQSPHVKMVCGNSDYLIHFDFDSEWDESPTKTARFIYGGKFEDVPFEGDTVNAPIIVNASIVAVGVFAGELRTTTPALIATDKSILCKGGLPADPPPDVYNKIIAMLNAIESPSWNDLTDRPFYAESAVILPETSLAYDENEQAFMLTEAVDLSAGSEYIVTLNGVEYTCIAQDLMPLMDAPAVGLGNLSALGIEGVEDTGEPFFCMYLLPELIEENGIAGMLVSLEGLTEITLSINGETVHKLDSKYIDFPTYTAAEVGAQVADFIVTFEQNEPYTADKTFEEVKAAYEAGATIVGVMGGVRYEMYGDGGGEGFGFINRVTTNTGYKMIWLWEGDSVTFRSASLDISHPVQSVNGKTGAVSLTASDVGALPNTTAIPTVPTNVSAFTNDAGYAKTTDIPSVEGLATEKYVDDAIAGIDIPEADVPSTLPNPNPLTFTGAVEATYDGSEAVSVEIPKGNSFVKADDVLASGTIATDTVVGDIDTGLTLGQLREYKEIAFVMYGSSTNTNFLAGWYLVADALDGVAGWQRTILTGLNTSYSGQFNLITFADNQKNYTSYKYIAGTAYAIRSSNAASKTFLVSNNSMSGNVFSNLVYTDLSSKSDDTPIKIFLGTSPTAEYGWVIRGVAK